MLTPIILVTDHFHPQALMHLQLELKCELQQTKSRQPTAEELASAEVLLIRSGTRIDTSLIELAPKLKLMVSATSGFDHIDFEQLSAKGIKAFHTPDANAASAAELTFLLLLNLCRHTPQLRKDQLIAKTSSKNDKNNDSSGIQAKTRNATPNWRENLPRGTDLKGKDLGLIGLGRVGQRVAKMANAFEMRVMAYDPYVEDHIFKDLGVAQLGLTEIFCESQILSLHIPLSPKTRHIINKNTISYMSEETLLINASRGAVVNESDLVLALNQNQLAGAALDVFEKEPLAYKSQLFDLTQVYLTPHIGAYTQEALERASFEAVKKVIQFFSKPQPKKAPPNEASPTAKIDCNSGELPPKSPWYLDLA